MKCFHFLYALGLFLLLGIGVFGEPLYSPAWGFRIDLPPDFQLTGGDKRNSFSFTTPDGAALDIRVYPSLSLEALTQDITRKLGNQGETAPFEVRHRKGALIQLDFSLPPLPGGRRGLPKTGWGLCLELDPPPSVSPGRDRPLIAVLAYGSPDRGDLQDLFLSCLDSLSCGEGDLRAPGPITEFSYPRETPVLVPLPGTGAEAWICREDAEAAQYLVDREFAVLERYQASPNWKEAWIRFYRLIYRDSFERLADIAFNLERAWMVPSPEEQALLGDALWDNGSAGEKSIAAKKALDEAWNRTLAEKALGFVQSFHYERDLEGSDFVNLVSAVLEQRGDCDSRALLWALILRQANIPTAIMVSREYGHAMGLIDLEGRGARFETGGLRWLVAETTARVELGLVAKDVSDPRSWLGILFE